MALVGYDLRREGMDRTRRAPRIGTDLVAGTPINHVSTKSAEASKRSADAAERNAAIAEARYHDDQEPAWTCVISGVEGGCDITATFDAGPPRLDVYYRLAGHV
ncbi:MAG: hypothetical protein LC799_09665, partial [Actinobacteria bacterium]|nr:hypothetical protein [Actinomycetota bacterium]